MLVKKLEYSGFFVRVEIIFLVDTWNPSLNPYQYWGECIDPKMRAVYSNKDLRSTQGWHLIFPYEFVLCF